MQTDGQTDMTKDNGRFFANLGKELKIIENHVTATPLLPLLRNCLEH